MQWPKQLNASLEDVDPELYDIIEHEKNRQYKVRQLLSANISHAGCLDAAGLDADLYTGVICYH